MQNLNYWKQFENTGKIEDYLNYRCCFSDGEGQQHNPVTGGNSMTDVTMNVRGEVGENSYAGIHMCNRNDIEANAYRGI